MVLRWDARKEQKGKHGKFDNLWFGPLILSKVLENNTFVLQTLESEELCNLVNGCFPNIFTASEVDIGLSLHIPV